MDCTIELFNNDFGVDNTKLPRLEQPPKLKSYKNTAMRCNFTYKALFFSTIVFMQFHFHDEVSLFVHMYVV